jgi:hypothetical protein
VEDVSVPTQPVPIGGVVPGGTVGHGTGGGTGGLSVPLVQHFEVRVSVPERDWLQNK